MEDSLETIGWSLRSAQETVFLEVPVGCQEGATVGDFIEGWTTEAPSVIVDRQLLREVVADALGTLQDRERRVLKLRYGIENGRARSLEEIGRESGPTRERIHQIEGKALRGLRHPSHGRRLGDHVE